MADPRRDISSDEELREVTWDDMAAHSAEENAWLVIYGRVYDVSGFLEEHPGGSDTLWQMAGTDASSEWDAVGHTSAAVKNYMEKMLVGKIVGKHPRRRTAEQKKKPSIEPMSPGSGQSFGMTMALVVLFLILAALYIFSS